jgi:hypothetical protein
LYSLLQQSINTVVLVTAIDILRLSISSFSLLMICSGLKFLLTISLMWHKDVLDRKSVDSPRPTAVWSWTG